MLNVFAVPGYPTICRFKTYNSSF